MFRSLSPRHKTTRHSGASRNPVLPVFLFLSLLLLLAAAPDAPPFHPSAALTPSGPQSARGALVWLAGSYDTDTEPVPPEQPWVARLARRGYDIWRFDRTPGRDPLIPGGEALIAGLQRLHAAGYARVIVAGHSRGAFIALAALAHPELADAVAVIDPAAHGTHPERMVQALADLTARLDAARGPLHLAFVQLRDEPFALDPDARAARVRAAAERAGLQLLLIDRPPAPTGHVGGFDPAFDALFGECLADFTDGGAAPAQCGAN
jgi:pimeloyl-ACP methyl ester carboxylesterase